MSTEITLPGGHHVTRFWSRGAFHFIVHTYDRALDPIDIAELARFAGFEVAEKPDEETGGSQIGSAPEGEAKSSGIRGSSEGGPPVLTKGGGSTCPACLGPRPSNAIYCPIVLRKFTPDQFEAYRVWHHKQPRTAVCSHPCPLVCEGEHCGADT